MHILNFEFAKMAKIAVRISSSDWAYFSGSIQLLPLLPRSWRLLRLWSLFRRRCRFTVFAHCTD